MRSLIAALLLLVSTVAAADEFKRGEIVDGVACVGHPEITYAVYLPARYTPQQQWPVLFVFDPRQRGAYAAELFREPAEQFGWIVISSNNTRSDSEAAPTVRAIAIMMPDAQRRFSVDARRNYVAGFSGTAIVAWSLAELTKSIAGVIGSSGRPGDTKMNYQVPFDWFGTAGTRDFNYMETLELDRGLAAAGANHRLEIFDGPHRWAPKEILRQGIAWMELLAMKAGRRSRDDAIVKQLFAEELAAARAEPDPLAAVRRYESIVRTFEGLIPIDEPVARVKEMRASRAFAKAVREEKHAEGVEISYRRTLGKAMQAFLQPSDNIPVAPRLAHDLQIESLQHLASRGSYEGLAAQRVLEGIYVQLDFYAAADLSGQKLAVVKEVAGLIHAPPKPEAWPKLWAGLQPGRYPVGFKSWLLRAQASEFKHGEQHLVQVSVWYPAAPNSGTPMTYRDYMLLKLTENSYAEPTEESRAAAIAEFTKSLTDMGVPQRTALAIVDSPLYARLNAQTPMGTVRYPIVYIGEGNGQTAADQAILSEFLASHGYIVVTSPSVTRITGPLAADARLGARAEEQADDIDRAVSATGDSPNAVNIPVSVLGYDIGADAALLYAMHRPTNALILIDGAFDSPSKIEALKAAPMFDAKVRLPPILSVHGEGNHAAATDFVRSLNASELIEQSVVVKHALFTTTGFLAAVFPEVAKATGASATIKRDVTATAGKALQFLDSVWMPTRPPA